MEETHYAFWLLNMIEIPSGAAYKLLCLAGSFEGIWSLTQKEIDKLSLKISPEKENRFYSDRDCEKIIDKYNSLVDKGIVFYHINSPGFPDKLKEIHNPPIGLYCLGKLPNQAAINVAIVGARNCSEYGRYVARKIGISLGKNGFGVISGLAHGIDGIAQRGALEAGGYSCGVLGCGVDICYPPENMDIYSNLLANGGIISEYSPQTPPKSHQFPARNRIISALSDVVVVIEARERSGSLITADMALDQGKDVYALPGRVTDSLSHGCNRLIRQGAGIILSPEEFIQDLLVNYSVGVGADLTNYTQLSLFDTLDLSSLEKNILNNLSFDPKSINEIQDETGLNIGELTSLLLKLSMRGLILQKGSFYIRTT